MWRLRVNEQLLVENDRAITKLFWEAVAEARRNLSKEFGISQNHEGIPDSDFVVEAMFKAAEGWQMLIWATKQLPLKENKEEVRVACRLLDRALDNFEVAFNHLILLKRYLCSNL